MKLLARKDLQLPANFLWVLLYGSVH